MSVLIEITRKQYIFGTNSESLNFIIQYNVLMRHCFLILIVCLLQCLVQAGDCQLNQSDHVVSEEDAPVEE